MSMDISVVMPLYNAKAYVKTAVDSVLAQTLADVEVLIVDDCSTDGSFELCRELYGQNERVRLLQNPRNMGPGAARNNGMRSARGKYVAFVDSDDEVLPDTFRNLFEAAEKYGADVVHNTHCVVAVPDENGDMPLEMIPADPDSDRGSLIVSQILDQDVIRETSVLAGDLSRRFGNWLRHSYNWVLWSKLFRRSFLEDHEITFGPMKLAEDMSFCLECLMQAGTYLILPGGGYIYRSVVSVSRGNKSPDNIAKYMRAQFQAAQYLQGRLGRIAFFRENPEHITKVVDFVLSDIEKGCIRPAYQVLGEAAVRDSEALRSLFAEYFGELAPYAEFLFFQLHNEYPDVIDYMGETNNAGFLKKIRARILEYRKAGRVIDDLSMLFEE